MGLLDVLNGMQNGPRGQRDPTASGGMSPITMAVLGLLAYKALKNFGSRAPGQTGAAPSAGPASSPAGSAKPGGLGDLLSGGLGGLLAGGAAGSVLSGGLADLVRQFQQSGHADDDGEGNWHPARPRGESFAAKRRGHRTGTRDGGHPAR